MKREFPATDFSGQTSDTASGPQAVLRLRDAIALIIGVVIGAGIFKAPSMVAGMAGNAEWMFAACCWGA